MKKEADKNEITRGTNAERLALPTANLQIGTRFFETDTKDIYAWNGIAWLDDGVQTSTGGAGNTSPQNGGASIIPSNYAASPVALSQAGDGYAISAGARYISIGMTTVAAGTAVLIAFGISELDAEANVSGTVGAEVGYMLGGGAAGDVYIVGVPRDSTITWFALAENHAVPTGDCIVTQGV